MNKKRKFECVRIRANDDGTYTIEATPVPEKKDGKEVVCFVRDKTYTGADLEEVFEKVRALIGGAADDEDLDGFMSPREEEGEEEQEK